MINKKDILKKAVKATVNEYEKGMKVEDEHRDITKGSKAVTSKIVKAHMKEIPDYYDRLEKLEDQYKRDKNNKEE